MGGNWVKIGDAFWRLDFCNDWTERYNDIFLFGWHVAIDFAATIDTIGTVQKSGEGTRQVAAPAGLLRMECLLFVRSMHRLSV
jgi:hypothetical protein